MWQIAALKTAEVLGITDATPLLQESREWLREVAHVDGRFGYRRKRDFPKGAPGLAAAGAWGERLAGLPGSATAAEGRAQLLGKNAPSARNADVYGWYYGALVMHARGGEDWGAWRDQLGQTLMRAQQADGSWAASHDKFGKLGGGRIYTTAMSLLALQAPQRYTVTR